MSATSDSGITWLDTEEIARHAADPARIAGFSIDSPRPGEPTPGCGLEIDGWVLGRAAPVVGIRAVHDAGASRSFAIDVLRPDVAADYPDQPWSSLSGFTVWVPVSPKAGSWRVTVEALHADGTATPLATLSGHQHQPRLAPAAGVRPAAGPDFVIIGAQRAGTTSLHAYLAAHPQVRPGARKELHYLTDRHERGRDWYLGQFSTALPMGTITGEATPYALFHPLAPHRLREVAPRAKLIALLRNPVNRAYSHYLLERAHGVEMLEFAAALQAEPSRLAGEEERLVAQPGYVSHAHNHASYLARGDYAPQLARWFEQFPREQFLILRSEDLYRRPAETFARVLAFLGLSPAADDTPFTAHNRSAGPPLDETVRERLARHFAPRVNRLRELLDWPIGWE